MILKDILFILLPVIGVMMGMIFEHKFCINDIEQIKSDIECLKNDIRCLQQQIEIIDKSESEDQRRKG